MTVQFRFDNLGYLNSYMNGLGFAFACMYVILDNLPMWEC